MSTIIHFINVGQGNMTLLELSDGKNFLYDCNVTNDNEDDVLGYLGEYIGWDNSIDVFINSHRDADHMRGIKKVHEYFPIMKIWDSGVTGTTPSCSEYKEYMELRREVGYKEIEARKYWDYGETRLRVMNSKNENLPKNPNAQSIVVKVVHRDSQRNINYDSAILTGDSDAVTWKDIQDNYADTELSCSILLAGHHGSLTFFDDPADDKNYYTKHIKAMSPAMTIVSVGDNGHGHPDSKALDLYEKYSTGSNKGNKIYRTDSHGNMRLELKDGGGWKITRT